jgi:hypothetical protein
LVTHKFWNPMRAPRVAPPKKTGCSSPKNRARCQIAHIRKSRPEKAGQKKQVRRGDGDAKDPLRRFDGRGSLLHRRCCRGTFGWRWSLAWSSAPEPDPASRHHVTCDATSPSPTVVCDARRSGFWTTLVVLSRRYLECRTTATATEWFRRAGRSIANRSARAPGSRHRSALAPVGDPVRDRWDHERQSRVIAGWFTDRLQPEHSRRRWQNAAGLYGFLGTGHAHEQDRVAGRV